MSLSNKQHKEMIVKYHHGLLSDKEKHQLEMDATEDLFLEEALEGYAFTSNKSLLSELESAVQMKIQPHTGGSFYRSFLLPFVVLSGIAFVLNNTSRPSEEPSRDAHSTPLAETITQRPTTASLHTDSVSIPTQPIPVNEWIQNIGVNKTTVKALETHPALMDSISALTLVPIPNAGGTPDLIVKKHPVYYLYNLKVANYKGYRSAIENNIELDLSLAARYENKRSSQEAATHHTMGYTRYLDLCMKDFSQDRLEAALRGFETILSTYSNDANALFYGGISAYNSTLTEYSIELLTQSASHPFGVFKEESEWFLSLAYIKKGDLNAAQTLLTKIASSNHFYKTRALLELDKIR